jgi:hypothetical protein
MRSRLYVSQPCSRSLESARDAVHVRSMTLSRESQWQVATGEPVFQLRYNSPPSWVEGACRTFPARLGVRCTGTPRALLALLVCARILEYMLRTCTVHVTHVLSMRACALCACSDAPDPLLKLEGIASEADASILGAFAGGDAGGGQRTRRATRTRRVTRTRYTY